MGGDGMVAIVQGLQDAGLAVTLMNSTHLQNSLKSNPVLSKSSVETSANVERTSRTTAAQVQDGHYASSYQLAHCNVKPSSPLTRLPEFPPQRLEPSRNQGNFQVGGYGSGEYQFSPSPSYCAGGPVYYGNHGYRGGMTWPDRGSVSRRVSPTSLPCQPTDPFVDSLRRYPLPISPERSVSSELVQRFLTYTQNKHLSKNPRSIRLLRAESPTRDQKTDTTSKNIQTYTRAKNEPTRDSGANTSNDIRFSFGKKGRSFASSSPYNVRASSDHHDTYDYLKASPRRGHHPEVRYLKDVKKCIRDTIKQMCDDEPLVCPRIKSRYSQHKKVHHNSQDSCSSNVQCGEEEASASTSNEIPLFATCQPPTAVQQTCPKHQVYCRKPTPCTCLPGSSTQEPTLTAEVPEREPKKAQEAPVDTTAVCTCKADAAKSGNNKIADEIYEWLKELPVYADDSPENKTTREDMIKDLADKLKSFEGDRNYKQKAKEAIKKCIEKLPMWYPGANREQFKNQIADDLLHRFTGVESTDELKDVIAKWVDEIQFENDAKVDKDDIVENFVGRLKPLVDKPDEMRWDIEDMLKELPIKNKNKVINNLTDKLINDLSDVKKDNDKLINDLSDVANDVKKDKRFSTDSTDEKLERLIMDWLEDIPELSSAIKDNKTMVKGLAKKLEKAQKEGLNDEQNLEKIKEEVVDWIDSILESKGEKLDSKTKAKLSNKLLDKLSSAVKFESKRQDRKSSLGELNDYEDQVWEWLDDVVDIPEKDKKAFIELVKSFADKLQDLISENADDEVILEEILDLLESLSKEGVAVSSRNKNNLAKKLMNKIKSLPKTYDSFSQNEDLLQSIISEISELVEDIPSNISKNKQKEIKDKVASILAKNINNLSDKTDNINREIVNILKKEAKMPENEATNLASAFINRIKGMPLSDLTKSVSSVSRQYTKNYNEIEQQVAEETSEILNDYNISPKKRNQLEKSITEVLADQIVRGTDIKQAKDNIISILQDANVSEDDALDISNRLLERNKELSLGYRTQDSRLEISKSKLNKPQSLSVSTIDREDFAEKAEREILDFIEDITGDNSPKTRKKRKEAAGDLFYRLGEIMSDPDETEKEKGINEELSQYLRKLSIDSDMPKGEMARKLASRLQGIGIQASTPKKEGYSFYPKRGTMDISSINIDDEDSQRFKKPAQVVNDEEKKYGSELTEIIHSWMDELPIDLSATDDKGFKETMIQDLASDIIDRQKYLQLNPDAETSNQEELEHLKYQVFRWLNKLLDTDDLSSVMQKTDILMRKIKDLNVPELVNPHRRKLTESKTGKHFIPDSMDSIKDEISIWMDEIPQNLYTSTDKNLHKQMINELAEKIQQFREKHQTEYIHSEISNWLSKLIKDIDTQEFTKLTKALEARLKERGFTEASFMPSQDSSQFVEENLIGGIQDWLKTLPLFQKRNSTEKRELESLIPDLVKGLKSVFISSQDSVADADKMYIDEIIKHMNKFPMDEKLKSDVEFLQRVAAQLLHYLKGLQIFTNISDRQDRPPDEYLTANLDDWVSSLPITRLNSNETMRFEHLKKEFAEKVKRIRQEDPENEQKLKDEIRSYLLKLPIEEDMKQNLKFISDKVEQLFKNLLAVPIEPILKPDTDKFVKNAVTNWIKLLPLDKGRTMDDIPTNAIDKLASAISNLLVKTDTTQIGDIKKTIEDETEKFLKSVPLDPSVNIDVKTLAETLFEDVKDMSKKRSSVAKPPPIKKAADILFDNIESWCENLPLKGITQEEKEKAKKIKQEIASKLIHKIGELNMNPEVFNDDFLYDDMLQDEIDNLLTDLSSEDIRKNLPAIKKNLMEKVKEARQKTQEEVAGQAYKQQLREAISKTLPSQPLSVEEQASFEDLKDNLADAFINLHYVGGDEQLKNKYKTKINDEVSKFCNDYLKKHPAAPIDSKKLNQDLYNALKGVPIPKEETVRNEVELVKIKDEVNDWVKDLPLKEQTAPEKMQTNKMIAVLAKKVHDIEKQKEIAPEADYDDIMRKEITKWMKKLPLNIDDAEVTKLTDKLINNLKISEKSRRVSASTRRSIEPDTFDVTPEVPNACQPTCSAPCRTQYAVPPSSLSVEDREHLQKIRERSPIPRVRYPPSKDASVSPLPIDAGSQTEIRPWEPCLSTCGKNLAQQSSGIQTQRPPEPKTMQGVGSLAEVSPHVIVKEYYWDPLDGTKGAYSPCPSQYPTAAFPPGCMNQMAERPVSQQPSGFTNQSQGACSQCPHMSPQSSIPGPYHQSPTPQPRRPRKEWEQPCYRRETPGLPPEDHPEPGTSRSFRTPKARVTRLGSFNDMQPTCSRSRHEWAKFPEEDEFWGDKRRSASEDEDEQFLKERRKVEEKVRCRCKERIITKCAGKKRGRGCQSPSQSTDDVKRCSKCCGVHCPYPSYLYFRQ